MRNDFGRMRRQRQQGQAATEFIIIGTLFLGLLGGLIEMTYVARAKILLNYATFDAARTGAVNNATVAQMAITLQQDMAPLYMQTNRTQAALQAATTQAQTVYTTMAAAGTATLKPLIIISPTQDIFNLFAEQQDMHVAGQTTETVQAVLPNDNLQWRDRTPQAITVNGANATINVQDANLLKIKAYWCQHLVVPGLEVLVHSIITSTTFETPAQTMCEAVGAQQNNFYIAIESDAVMPLQSPALPTDLP